MKKSNSRNILVEDFSATPLGAGDAKFEGLALICQALDDATSQASLTDNTNYGQTTIPHFLSTLFAAAETIIGDLSKIFIHCLLLFVYLLVVILLLLL